MKDIPFRTLSVPSIGGHVTVARFVCACCDAKKEIPIFGDRRLNPEFVVKTVRKAGWDARYPGLRAECPRCLERRRKRAAGESPKEPSILPPLEPAQMASVPTVPTVPTVPNVVPAPLTPDQRLKIRAILDRQFDDAKGHYLDGYSDQMVATEVNVPRVHVEAIREAAYGPIREDPAVVRARAEMEKVKAEVGSLLEKLASAEQRAKALLQTISR